MSTILLATNGSNYAEAAADQAVELARKRNATLHVMCVVDRRVHEEPALSSYELEIVAAEDEGAATIEAVKQACAEVDVEAEGSVIHGVPEEGIVEYADEIDADTIVIGEHGDHADHLGGVGRTIEEMTDRDVVIVGLEN